MNTQKMLELANLLDNVEPQKFHMSSWFGRLIPAIEHEYYEDICEFFNEDDLVPYHFSNSEMREFEVEELIKVDNNSVSLTCGTTACIAGWAIVNEFYQGNTEYYNEYINNGSDPQTEACRILGLTSSQAMRLFYCGYESIWSTVANDYNLEFDFQVNETWDIHPKYAADVLRRVVSGELSLDKCNCNDCREE
jgi:hypothetical protein